MVVNPIPVIPRILQLPSEIRIQIYKAVLLQTHPIRIWSRQSENEKRLLLGVCRQVYWETLAIYYSGNAFITESAHCLIPWLTKLGEDKRALLRDVRLRMPLWTSKSEEHAICKRSLVARLSAEVRNVGTIVSGKHMRVRAERKIENTMQSMSTIGGPSRRVLISGSGSS